MKVMTLLGVSVAVLSVSVAWAGQVTNGSFEEGTSWQVPTGWSGFGTMPAVKFESFMPWGSEGVPPPDGTYFAGESANYGTKNGGIYQQVSVCTGKSGTATVKMKTGGDTPDHANRGRIGIDPTGGMNYLAGTVQWAAWGKSDSGYTNISTPNVTSTGTKVTVFIQFDIPYMLNKSFVFFDLAALTGTLLDPCDEHFPPVVSNVAVVNTAPVPVGDISINYTLTDPESDDAAATLTPQYRLGTGFDGAPVRPSWLTPVVPPQSAMGSSCEGNGNGTGTYRVTGQSDGITFDTERTGTTYTTSAFGHAGEAFTVGIEVCDWTTTRNPYGYGAQYQGCGVFIAKEDLSAMFIVGAFQYDTGEFHPYETMAHWNGVGGSNPSGIQHEGYNLEVVGWPTDGVGRMGFRLTRTSNALVASYHQRDSDTWIDFFSMPTPPNLSFSSDLITGIVVNDGTIVNIDLFATQFQPAANKAGQGDGTSNLTSGPSGNPHTFVWEAANNLSSHLGPYNAEVKLTATDADGPGTPGTTGFFEIDTSSLPTPSSNSPTPVPNTPTNTPVVNPPTNTPTNTPTTGPTAACCLGDANHDQNINQNDYRSTRDHFGQQSSTGDGDCNGTVNQNDYRATRDHFGQSCQ